MVLFCGSRDLKRRIDSHCSKLVCKKEPTTEPEGKGGQLTINTTNIHPSPEGPFQSDALLVPEHCLFDHIHNQTKCWNFDQWNSTAARACSDRSMKLRSFAMLLPCGIDVFSGVEFVCCPTKKVRKGDKRTFLQFSLSLI